MKMPQSCCLCSHYISNQLTEPCPFRHNIIGESTLPLTCWREEASSTMALAVRGFFATTMPQIIWNTCTCTNRLRWQFPDLGIWETNAVFRRHDPDLCQTK